LKLLLDTHIWLWLLHDPSLLRHRTLQYLRDKNNELWLSPISTYEALTLHCKKRIRLHGDLSRWLEQATAGTQEAPLTHEIAFLAATALALDLILVTADRKLLGLGNIKTLGNN
jgi:PIN domain nuclease of toxin-antitoxin system